MTTNRRAVHWAAVVIVASIALSCSAATTLLEGVPRIAELKVRVVDARGKPVDDAKVTPWALRSSQGHGWWRHDDKSARVDPRETITDAAGNATVAYPYYRDLREGIRTISVSLAVDHAEFAYRDDLHIDVPLETSDPYLIELAAGIPLEVRPMLDGKPANSDALFVRWSDGRTWKPGAGPQRLPEGVLRVPAMPSGDNSVLLVMLQGERATHFSKITDFKLALGQPKRLDVTMRPGIRMRGALSPNVPRPVRAGRLKAETLDPANATHNRAGWFTWVPIQPDGTFTLDSWPAEEPLQVIALCEGFIASSGAAPAGVKNPPDPAKDRYNRPQVFRPGAKPPIEVAMTPLVRCMIAAVDEDEAHVAGVQVVSWPNVGWWNGGSQIYCDRLVRGERLLRERDYFSARDTTFPQPFTAVTDAKGKATLELPAGKESLAVMGQVYELPIFLGNREVQVTLTAGETTEAVLHLQPRGTEKLGEWDKLAGVVFGCSTREGRRICALPSVQRQMEEFAARFREGKNQRDPQLLCEAYTLVANAFQGVGDLEESTRWRKKAADQAQKAQAARPKD